MSKDIGCRYRGLMVGHDIVTEHGVVLGAPKLRQWIDD